MNVLEARRKLLDGEIKKRTAEGEDISVRSVARMRPGLTLYGKSEQETTTGAQLLKDTYLDNVTGAKDIFNSDGEIIIPQGISTNKEYNIHFSDISDILTQMQDDDAIYICIRLIKKINQSEFNYQIAFKNAENITIIDTSNDNIKQTTYSTLKNSRRIQCYFYNNNQSVDISGNVFQMIISRDENCIYEPYTGGAPSPSPDYPQEIKSVGDSGTINVSLSDGGSQSQTLPVQAPNGLPGIPVSSGGNYTDADGQQWICDEVDFERGVYVQRVKKTSNITWIPHNGYTIEDSELFKAVNITDGLQRGISENQELSSKLIKDITILNYNKSGFYQSYGSIFARIKGVSELDEFKQLMADAEFLYCLETPIETSLSPSELATYAALRTYSPTTVVSNDAGAWMKLGYKTKKSLEVTTI